MSDEETLNYTATFPTEEDAEVAPFSLETCLDGLEFITDVSWKNEENKVYLEIEVDFADESFNDGVLVGQLEDWAGSSGGSLR